MLVQPQLPLPAAQILQKRKRETQGVGLAIFARVNASSPLLCPPQELERGIHKPGVAGMAVIFALVCWYPLLLRSRRDVGLDDFFLDSVGRIEDCITRLNHHLRVGCDWGQPKLCS